MQARCQHIMIVHYAAKRKPSFESLHLQLPFLCFFARPLMAAEDDVLSAEVPGFETSAEPPLEEQDGLPMKWFPPLVWCYFDFLIFFFFALSNVFFPHSVPNSFFSQFSQVEHIVTPECNATLIFRSLMQWSPREQWKFQLLWFCQTKFSSL